MLRIRTTQAGRTALTLAIAALAAVLGAPSARADFFTPTVEVTEVMMEALGQEGANIATQFGFDEIETLHLSTHVDPDGRSFRYETLPGTTYLGEPLSIVTTGAYDSGDGLYRWVSLVTRGAESYTADGSLEFGAPAGDTVEADTKTTIEGVKGTLGKITWRYLANGDPESRANFTFCDKDGNLAGIRPVKDVYKGNGKLEWVFVARGDLAGVAVDGQSDPIVGGDGTTTIRIGSIVPEPSGLALLGLGAACLLGLGRRVGPLRRSDR